MADGVITPGGMLSRDEARTMLAQERAQRERECNAAIIEILQRLHCHLEAEVVIRGQAIVSRIVIVPEE